MDRIGHYKIVSELGRGGMGIVYKAHEESLNRFVAIKMLGEHLEEEADYVARFVREAQSAAALSHPNIVQIYAISEDQGHHYFVMEYVQGTSVQRMIRSKGKLVPAEAARLILQAAAGLEAAHAQGVIHRDIKPANLMVTDRGLVKIADFGLALMGTVTSRLTATGMLMGTPGYLSPEQCLDQSVDHQTDIYSLGVTFFEMLTGTMPFRADSPLALLKLIVEVEPPDVRDLNPEVDDTLRAILARMLAKDRGKRYSSCSEIITDLESWLTSHGEPVHSVAGAGVVGTGAGLAPPPRPATDEEINTHPTVAVDSGSAGRPTPPPPPAAPAAVAEAGTMPAPHATAPTTQPGPAPRRTSIALVIAAVVVFVVAAGGVAAVLAVKSGLLGAIFQRGKTAAAELEKETDAGAPTAGEAPADGTAAAAAGVAEKNRDHGDDGALAAGTGGSDGTGSRDSAGGGDAVKVAEATVGSSSSGPSARSAAGSADAGGAPRETAPKIASGPARPPAVAAVLPTATVVIGVGDRLLAVEAEDYVKARLEQAGVEVIDVTSIPGLEGLTATETRPAPGEIREALRPYARYLVPVRVESLGERDIYYMGQRDTAYQARVNLALVDLETGQPLSKPANVKLEYTQLNAERVVGDKLRQPTTAIVQRLPPR